MARTLKLSTRLKKARALIADPRNWTQNAFVRKDSKAPVGARFCAIGACAYTATGSLHPDKASDACPSDMRDALWNCASELFDLSVVSVNDTKIHRGRRRTRKTAHAEVVTMFDCAISKAAAAERAAKQAV